LGRVGAKEKTARVSRVEWSRLDGELCEGVLGVLLLRRHPTAQRVRPSRGDRGVDVYVPTGDGWVVYQIKSFTGALTSSQKRQIRKSWTRFRALVDERRLTIIAWHLMRPENPTWEDDAFLTDLTTGAPWPCTWRGLDVCDELAAAYPDVIDYYLRDGKERLEHVLRAHLTAAGFAQRTAGDPIAPAATTATLHAVHAAINAVDPHYRYDFGVTERPPGSDPSDRYWPTPRPAVTDDLVASVTRYDVDRAVTFHVFHRFAQAHEERPVPMSFHVIAEPGTAEYHAWQDFLDFGIATPDPLPVDGLSLGLPGELGTTDSPGLVRLGPSDSGQPPIRWTLRILDAERRQVASIEMEGGPPARGLTGRGWSLHLHDPRGAISLLLKVETETGATTYHLTHLPLFGKAPHDLLPGMRIAAAFCAPHTIELGRAGGPSLAEAMTLTGPANPAFTQVVGMLENLATIAQHTYTLVTVPEMPHVIAQARDWELAARLLRGETLTGTAPPMAVDAGDLAVAVGDLFATTLEDPLTVDVGTSTIELGSVVRTYTPMRVVSVCDEDGRVLADLVPHGPSRSTAHRVLTEITHADDHT
jgi:hypothetical protein